MTFKSMSEEGRNAIYETALGAEEAGDRRPQGVVTTDSYFCGVGHGAEKGFGERGHMKCKTQLRGCRSEAGPDWLDK